MRPLSAMWVRHRTDLFLQTIRDGFLRGTIRGNAIAAAVLVITDTAWLVYEHGGRHAFSRPSSTRKWEGISVQ